MVMAPWFALGVLAVLLLGVRRVCGADTYSPVSLFVYLIALLLLFRPGVLLLGLDVPDPWYVFPGRLDDVVNAPLASGAVWLLAFLVGFVGLGRVGELASNVLPTVHREVNLSRLAAGCIVSSAVSVLLAIDVIASVGFENAIASVRRDNYFLGFKFLEALPQTAGVISAVSAALVLDLRARNWIRVPRAYSAAVIGSLIVTSSVSLLFGNRSAALLPAFFVAVSYLFILGKGGRALRYALPILFIVGVLFVTQVRQSALPAHSSSDVAVVPRVSAALNLNNFDHLALLMRDWSQYAYPHPGQDFVTGASAVIPRFIWEDKPEHVSPGIWLRAQYVPTTHTGWPLAMWGEWYVNFGSIGILLSGIFAGIIYRALETRYRRDAWGAPAFVVAGMLAFLVFPYGYISTTPIRIVLVVVPMGLFTRWIRGHGRERY